MIIRSIPVPPDLPDGFDAVIVVYARSDNRNTRFTARINQDLLDALVKMPQEKKVETIAYITGLIEQTIVASIKVTAISDASSCH